MPPSSKLPATKRPTKPPATKVPATKRPATKRVKPSDKAAPSSGKPFLRFYHSEILRQKTLDILNTVEKAKDRRQHRDDLAKVIVELTDSGMEYFFLRPLKVAKAGFFVEQSAKLGMAAATGVIASAIRTIIGRMDQAQLLAVCGYMRELMK